MNYDYFGVEYYGECWGGSSDSYYRHGPTGHCHMVKDDQCAFEDCDIQRKKLCVGRDFSLYVYKLQKRK